MTQQTPSMNLNGAKDLIKKSKHPLTPLYEAITNSLEAMDSRTYGPEEKREITIRFHFGGLLDDRVFQRISVTDNGVGFNYQNYSRFKEFFDKSKGYNNRGSGRLQFLHRFKKIVVDSVFQDGETKLSRHFECSAENFIIEETCDEIESSDPLETTVTLEEFLTNKSEQEYFDTLELDQVIRDLKRLLLLRFYLDSKKGGAAVPSLKVMFVKNESVTEERSLTSSDMPEPVANGQVEVKYVKLRDVKASSAEWISVPDKNEEIKWAHFKMDDSHLDQNGVYLCSKNIPVENLNFKHLKKNESVHGFKYLTAFYGDVLDASGNVNQAVDGFTFPEKKKIEANLDELYFAPDEEFLFFDDIRQEIDEALPSIYHEVIEIKKDQDSELAAIAKAHGIPLDVASEAKIGVNDDEKTITEKIYGAQSKRLAKKGFEVKKLYESLEALNPTSEDYQEELEKKSSELSGLIDQQNKEELSRYVIRREMVAEMVGKILGNELLYQNAASEKNKDKEGLIHDLIFKRKSADTKGLNDLWILDEEFVHFEGCSELPLSQITLGDGEALLETVEQSEISALGLKLDRRPDIFLFATEGKCVLIELKSIDTDLSDHLAQMPKYCTLIANYSKRKIDKFYCYLIGEKLNPITDLNEYEETVNGDWIRSGIPIRGIKTREQIALAQIEVIRLSSLRGRATRRNQSFAEKLGLPSLLEAARKRT